jgi:hypothetical protein
MAPLFDVDVIRSQIENLRQDRDRIDKTISALELALHSHQGVGEEQLPLALKGQSNFILQDAVQKVCLALIDGITRQRVTDTIAKYYPGENPVPSSVSAALINFSRGDTAILNVAIEGSGRSPTVYSVLGTVAVKLTAEEERVLVDPGILHGTGGWQNLWRRLQKSFDKSTGEITLTPELRAKLYQYYTSYGVGGWQAKVKAVFRRSLSHLFTS